MYQIRWARYTSGSWLLLPLPVADPSILGDPSFIGGSNPTATKARLQLTACMMKFGSLPPAAEPDHPTSAETADVRKKVAEYQRVFDTH